MLCFRMGLDVLSVRPYPDGARKLQDGASSKTLATINCYRRFDTIQLHRTNTLLNKRFSPKHNRTAHWKRASLGGLSSQSPLELAVEQLNSETTSHLATSSVGVEGHEDLCMIEAYGRNIVKWSMELTIASRAVYTSVASGPARIMGLGTWAEIRGSPPRGVWRHPCIHASMRLEDS